MDARTGWRMGVMGWVGGIMVSFHRTPGPPDVTVNFNSPILNSFESEAVLVLGPSYEHEHKRDLYGTIKFCQSPGRAVGFLGGTMDRYHRITKDVVDNK